jgi:hypothetical protein
MEIRVAEFTVKVVFPEILPEAAEMIAVPAATAVARPLPLTVATDVFEEVQVACVVISLLDPSEYDPVAVNCWVTPAGMLGVTGVIEMLVRFFPPPHVVRHIAKEPRNNIAKTTLILFMTISSANGPAK